MVNYCCAQGCGRNSRNSKHLFFYTAPKDLKRQIEWFKAVGREDLLEKTCDKRILYRFCSRHFSPSSIKNKHLTAGAVPTIHTPYTESEDTPSHHPNIICDNCRNNIIGFRYKCLSCSDYDLCPKCEMTEIHSHHFMLRIPTHTKFKKLKYIINKWQEYCNEKLEDDSSDDEPITKYATNIDSVVDLPYDVKAKIQMEVAMVLQNKSSGGTTQVTRYPEIGQPRSLANDNVRVQLADFIKLPNTNQSNVSDIQNVADHVVYTNGHSSSLNTDNYYQRPLTMNIKSNNDDLTGLMMEVEENCD